MTTTNPKQHIHHDMIVEWAKNPNRKMEFKSQWSREWMPMGGEPLWNPLLQYRFAPEVATITYRKALMINMGSTGYRITNIYGQGITKESMETPFFVKWLGDPITETIEI